MHATPNSSTKAHVEGFALTLEPAGFTAPLSRRRRVGKSVDFLYDAASGLDTEVGIIWVYGPGDTEVMAFTDFGIEMLLVSIEELRKLEQSKS